MAPRSPTLHDTPAAAHPPPRPYLAIWCRHLQKRAPVGWRSEEKGTKPSPTAHGGPPSSAPQLSWPVMCAQAARGRAAWHSAEPGGTAAAPLAARLARTGENAALFATTRDEVPPPSPPREDGRLRLARCTMSCEQRVESGAFAWCPPCCATHPPPREGARCGERQPPALETARSQISGARGTSGARGATRGGCDPQTRSPIPPHTRCHHGHGDRWSEQQQNIGLGPSHP